MNTKLPADPLLSSLKGLLIGSACIILFICIDPFSTPPSTTPTEPSTPNATEKERFLTRFDEEPTDKQLFALAWRHIQERNQQQLRDLLVLYPRTLTLTDHAFTDKGATGKTLLHIACYETNLEAITLLLDFGIDPKAQDDSGKTARERIIEAVQRGAARTSSIATATAQIIQLLDSHTSP